MLNIVFINNMKKILMNLISKITKKLSKYKSKYKYYLIGAGSIMNFSGNYFIHKPYTAETDESLLYKDIKNAMIASDYDIEKTDKMIEVLNSYFDKEQQRFIYPPNL